MAIMSVAVIKELPTVPSGKACDLHLLVRLEFPVAQCSALRPPVHLALVLDRSGSMAEKLELTKQAAIYFMNWVWNYKLHIHVIRAIKIENLTMNALMKRLKLYRNKSNHTKCLVRKWMCSASLAKKYQD